MSTTPLPDVLGPFGELNDLKRITSAGRLGSVATRLFAQAWAALVAGTPAKRVAGWITGRALAAARLGDIDTEMLVAAGLTRQEARRVEAGALEAVAGPLLPPLQGLIDDSLGDEPVHGSAVPAFVSALTQQPRAGITCPGKPRILLEPPENHAEHCLMVAVYGVLLSPAYRADPSVVFLAGLSHHFHNAGMPDSGFTGEMLLGAHLPAVMAHHTAACLDQLSPGLRQDVVRGRSILPDAGTPEGRAFHAADVLDRVLQVNQYGRAASLTPEQMLRDMELVHAGPVKAFQDGVLQQAGLL